MVLSVFGEEPTMKQSEKTRVTEPATLTAMSGQEKGFDFLTDDYYVWADLAFLRDIGALLRSCSCTSDLDIEANLQPRLEGIGAQIETAALRLKEKLNDYEQECRRRERGVA
jgi:hypothetical protein